VIANVVEHQLGVGDAIECPRPHFDEPHVHCEGGSTRTSSIVLSRAATTSSAGGATASSAEGRTPSRCSPPAVSRRRATSDAAARAWLSA